MSCNALIIVCWQSIPGWRKKCISALCFAIGYCQPCAVQTHLSIPCPCKPSPARRPHHPPEQVESLPLAQGQPPVHRHWRGVGG